MSDLAGMDFSADFSGVPGILLSVLIGLCLGSFATAMTWRIPRGQSWIATRGRAEHSACPSCGHPLRLLDLIPFFSWVALRGHCRYCGAGIGWRYPVIELLTLALCVIINLIFGITPAGLVLMLAMPFLVALVAIDLEHMILPNQLNLILWVLGVAYICVTRDGGAGLQSALLASLIYAVLSFVTGWAVSRVLKKEAMGFGDVKFFAVAGLWLGVSALPAFLMLSGVAGVVMGLAWKIIWKRERFPFGPSLIVAFLLCLIFLEQINALLY
ncbi:MAG: type fimbrial biosis protein prepilin cysteine protease PilD [Micavibrio sp.]|nr:type fimbrial biosis protein prepilin cysteine protease PilD [Micavibrio sp.]